MNALKRLSVLKQRIDNRAMRGADLISAHFNLYRASVALEPLFSGWLSWR